MYIGLLNKLKKWIINYNNRQRGRAVGTSKVLISVKKKVRSSNIPYRQVAYIGELPTFAKTTLKPTFYTNTFIIELERRFKRLLD
jgi:hypothetical protein